MPYEIHERVGLVEQEIHTLRHRADQLEQWPPRVQDLEASMAAMNSNMIQLQRSQQETRDEMRHGLEGVNSKLDIRFDELRNAVASRQGQDAGFSRALKWITGIVAIMVALAGGIAGYRELSAATVTAHQAPQDIAAMTAQCNDGSYSTSEGRGTCSHRGGVKRWLPE